MGMLATGFEGQEQQQNLEFFIFMGCVFGLLRTV
jgi:hypothetical protein